MVNEEKPDYALAAQGLDEVAKCIAEFHAKMQFETHSLYDEEVNDEVRSAVNHDLLKAKVAISHWANKLQSLVKFSVRGTRGHLCCEELSELLRGLLEQNEELTLDGAIDLLYVTIGTLVALGLPVGEAFMEVHLSNMSKEKQITDPYANRVRDKGPNYRAPDLAGVLERWHLIRDQALPTKALESSAASSSAGDVEP